MSEAHEPIRVFSTCCPSCGAMLYWNQKPGTTKDPSKARCSDCSPGGLDE